MTNRSDSLTWLIRCLKARVPLITIRTIEPNRAREIVRTAASELRALAFYEHSRTEGTRDLLSGQLTSEETSIPVALEYARSVFKARENANFLFTDIEDIDSETSTARLFAEMVRLAESRVGSIILVTSKPVWTGLSRLGMTVALDLPDQQELEDEITDLVETNRNYLSISWERHHVRQASEILSGVTLLEATNILATVMASGELHEHHLQELSQYKDQIFGDLNGIERVPLREDYQVGGLSSLKDWLARRRTLMSADLTHTPVSAPRGVLLVGVSGCGKSLSAKAIAQEWRLPLYRLDMAAVLGADGGQAQGPPRGGAEAGGRLRRATGREAPEADWDFFAACYRRTYREHRSTPYLTREFFGMLASRMPDNVLLVIAERDGRPIAAAMDLFSREALYGRYWGAVEFVPGLHFEACYYQAVEFAIEHGIALVEGGAQGEHKHARGFLPEVTRSFHWLAHPPFARAVDDFLAPEGAGLAQYAHELAERSPFRKAGG